MSNRFDDLSVALATATTRREALRRVGGLLAGAFVASLGFDSLALGRPSNDCKTFCQGRRGNAHRTCMSGCKRCARQGLKPCFSGRSGAVECCAAGLSCCDSQCVKLGENPDHCGRCGNACPENKPDCCPDPDIVAFCTNLAGDDFNCRVCGHPCAGGETCEAGTCIGVCPAHTYVCEGHHGPDCCADGTQPGQPTEYCCDGGCCPNGSLCCFGADGLGYCANLDTDADNCGGCHKPCPPGVPCCGGECCNSACARCENGECISNCPSDLICCPDGVCHFAGSDLPAHCCKVPNGGYEACGAHGSCCYPSNYPNAFVCCPNTSHCCPNGCQGEPCPQGAGSHAAWGSGVGGRRPGDWEHRARGLGGRRPMTG